MKAVLPRTGSVPVLTPLRSGSPRVGLSRHDSVSGIFSGERHLASSPKISMNFEMNNKRISGIRRALSESDIIRSENNVSSGLSKLSGAGSCYVPSRIPEEELISDGNADDIGSLIDFDGLWSGSTNPVDVIGKGRSSGGDEDGENKKIDEYYRELLKLNPTDSLLLRNYGKFLHEVEKDAEGAEEYYGRAILASPGDGELLSLYGNLIWTTERDEDRAKSYLDQAVHASPDDCMVLGSYARFMWEVEEEEEENKAEMAPAMVAAF